MGQGACRSGEVWCQAWSPFEKVPPGRFLPFLDEGDVELVAEVEEPSTFLGAREATTAERRKRESSEGGSKFRHQVSWPRSHQSQPNSLDRWAARSRPEDNSPLSPLLLSWLRGRATASGLAGPVWRTEPRGNSASLAFGQATGNTPCCARLPHLFCRCLGHCLL